MSTQLNSTYRRASERELLCPDTPDEKECIRLPGRFRRSEITADAIAEGFVVRTEAQPSDDEEICSIIHCPDSAMRPDTPRVNATRMQNAGFTTHLGALCIMALGCMGVLGLVLAMNSMTPPPAPTPDATNTAFAIQPKPKPPKVRRERPKPRKTHRHSSARVAKPTVLSTITGPSFGIPTLESSELLAGGDSPVGDPHSLIMTEDAVDELPTAKSQPAPKYPARARARGVEGFVVLNLLINSGGNVETVRVLESSPPHVFESAATTAVREWKFQPATYKGEAVRVWAKQVVRFNLS